MRKVPLFAAALSCTPAHAQNTSALDIAQGISGGKNTPASSVHLYGEYMTALLKPQEGILNVTSNTSAIPDTFTNLKSPVPSQRGIPLVEPSTAKAHKISPRVAEILGEKNPFQLTPPEIKSSKVAKGDTPELIDDILIPKKKPVFTISWSEIPRVNPELRSDQDTSKTPEPVVIHGPVPTQRPLLGTPTPILKEAN